MLDLVVALVSFTAVVALLLLAAVLVTVAPLYAALHMADRRGFARARWAAFSAVTILAALAYVYLLHAHTSLPTPVVLLPLALAWAGPGALWLLEAEQSRLGGRAGRHE